MTRFFAYFSIIAGLLFLITVVALLFLAPEVSPLQSGVSFYALTGYRLAIGIALALAGVSGISLALALWPAGVSGSGRVGLALLIAWGISSIAGGVFPLDAPGSVPTLAGSIHNLAGLNFLLAAPAVLWVELTCTICRAPAVRGPGTLWLAWAVLAAAVLLFVFNGPFVSLGIGGLVQRAYWLLLVLWLVLKALRLLRVDIAW
jgi:hypothetical protein